MKNNFTLRWTIANAVGLSLAFLVVQQFLMFYSYGLNFEMYWDFDADKTLSQSGRESLMATGIPIGLTLFGIIFTLAQALILKKFLPKIWPWILNGALGFVIIFLIIWLLRDIWGSIPGPVEPLIIVIGGLIFTIILQWRFLKKNGIKATRPFLMFTTGALLGVALLFPLFYIIGDVPWSMEIAVTGLIVGGLAGFLSAKHFQKVFEDRSM